MGRRAGAAAPRAVKACCSGIMCVSVVAAARNGAYVCMSILSGLAPWSSRRTCGYSVDCGCTARGGGPSSIVTSLCGRVARRRMVVSSFSV